MWTVRHAGAICPKDLDVYLRWINVLLDTEEADGISLDLLLDNASFVLFDV